MSVANILKYDECQRDTFVGKIGSDINKIPYDEAPLLCVLGGGLLKGGAAMLGKASKEMAGGLVSNNYAIPTNWIAAFFAMNVRYQISKEMLAYLGRLELDCKITLKSGSSTPLPNQINGSNQLNPVGDGTWKVQVDPTGSAWVDSGYIIPSIEPDTPQEMQYRWSLSGSVWNIDNLWNGQGAVYYPPSQFRNIPLITTNWGTGLHPQLQTEATGAPCFLVVNFLELQIIASDQPIAMGWM